MATSTEPTPTLSHPPAAARAALVSRGLWLNWATLSYNVLEAIFALVTGVAAGSVALVGFGIDSVIEVTSSVAAQWRLRSDHDGGRRVQSEFVALRVVGWCFLALALYIVIDSGKSLLLRERPEPTIPGTIVLALSALVMPVLARAKRRVALAMESRALAADATQTSLCAYLSVIALTGVGLNTFLGWWWADPVAALCLVPIIVREGLEGIRNEASCVDCC